MNCPKCNEQMAEIRKDGVYIDVCRLCRGVFLDAGELEILLYDKDSKSNYHKDHNYYKHSYKKKSIAKTILGEFLDF